jgi:hypothetical protein
MNRAACFLFAVLAAGTALCQSSDDQKRADFRAKIEKISAIEKRIYQTRPNRREQPARADNISDDEVREIQGIALQVMPGSILNISTVVTGCPCEETPSCSDQVWIVGYQPKITRGISLSKIDNHWQVGAVQRWWFDYEDLQARRKQFRSFSDYRAAEDDLDEQFPVCKDKALPAESPRK